ncbi:type IX secretion system sortase PorU [Labilibacter sediminis]|nr:type IX secretion system sortase PorU [Labilibacter sediminis]
MNNLKIGVLGVFFVLGMTLFGQNKFQEHNTINWLDPVKITIGDKEQVILQFDQAGEINQETFLPVYHKTITLPSDADPKSVQITLSNCKFIWPKPKEHTAFIDKINNDSIVLNYSVSQSGQQYYVDISFTPIQKPQGALSFQKLVSYTLEVTYNNRAKGTLKSSSNITKYVENSVLSQGKWIKVRVSETGVHKIPYSTLANWGISNPQNVGIYGNGGKMLPKLNSEFREDDLVENGVLHVNNAVFFYAEGPTTWKYDQSQDRFMHEKHDYSDHSYYFITQKDNASREIEASDLQSENYTLETDYFQDYDFHEVNHINLIKSGREWFGEKFSSTTGLERNFNFSFPHIKSDSNGNAYIKLAARSGSRTTFSLELNDSLIGSTSISSISIDDHIGYQAKEGLINSSFTNNSNNLDFKLKYSYPSGSSSSLGYLDYISVNVLRELIFTGNQLKFRNADVSFKDQFVKYKLGSTNNNVILWDVSYPLTPLLVKHSNNGPSSEFIYKANELKEFVAFDPTSTLPSPALVGDVQNQNLHSLPNVNFIIVSHPTFKEQAIRLGEIHKQNNNTSYLIVTPNEIYNEFSSGKPDVTAIRSFVKMFYDRAGTNNDNKPKNLLLFGDGSYDNRDGVADKLNNILTYQSVNSVHNTNSYVSDDYFGFLDDTEGTNIKTDKLDIGIGRFPVNTLEEAKNAVDKTFKYLNEQSLDAWKNKLTFVADDGDNNIHMRDADLLTIKVDKNHPEYDINKVYFDAYEKTSTSSGHFYPEVENEIYNALHEGTLLFNYTGHGGPNALAHEQVITKTKIMQWKNINKLPLFVTATCEFSRFDDKGETTAGELVFLNPLGGGIALFTTTRIVYSSLNFIINNSFYDHVFELNENGAPLTFGEIMQRTKINSGTSINKLNFTLLGDPALQLAYPKMKVNTTKVNRKSIDSSIDSLKALSIATVDGIIANTLNDTIKNFGGEVFVTVFDKPTLVTTLGNEGANPFQYETYNNIIFKGRSTVENGKFNTEFLIPKDIRYNYDTGKISYYSYANNDEDEAFGAFNEIVIGGVSDNISQDDEGPDIDLWLNDKNFNSGDQTTPSPVLLVDIYDENGINTTGNGIGHDITCVLNGDIARPIVLNSFFQSDLNSYQSGTIYYQLPVMEKGKHTLTLKAWDTSNNSSEETISFTVSNTSAMEISECIISPNPVKQGIPSYFQFEHDEPNTSLDINILVYTIAGQLVSSNNTSVVSLNNTVPPLEWHATTTNGQPLVPGIYVYQLIINSQTGRKGKVSGKIMVTE